LAHCFSLELLNELIGGGLATGSSESMMRGSKPVEILRVKITEAGRRALQCPSRSGAAARADPRPERRGVADSFDEPKAAFRAG
jgi:hypothetical protein